MKTHFDRFCFTKLFLLLVLALCTASPLPGAPGETVTISAAEFQRMVYSAHLLTVLQEKPELDASLQILLELQRRNPQAHPVALTALLEDATQCYRTNAPAHIVNSAFRDESLAAYLGALQQVPASTNFVLPTLQLLNHFMLSSKDYLTAPQSDLIHSGNQRLLASESALLKREEMLDTCIARAESNPAFGYAMDRLLVPKTFFSRTNAPAEIIVSTNSPLQSNLTMRTLLELSTNSGTRGLTVSSNQLMNLFTNETRTFWDIINASVALQQEISISQADLLSYLTNQPAINTNTARILAFQKVHAPQIATATAAILVQSKLMEAAATDPTWKVSKEQRKIVSALDNICRGISTGISAGMATGGAGAILGVGGIEAGLLNIFDLASGEESPDDTILREMGNIQTLINDLSVNQNYRFDRVDQALNQIYQTLSDGLNDMYTNMHTIRRSLLEEQANMHRLERHVESYLRELAERPFKAAINTYLNYEGIYRGVPMGWSQYQEAESAFYNAVVLATDNDPWLTRDYTPTGLYWELTEASNTISTGTIFTNRLDQNIKYIKRYLDSYLAGGPYTDTGDQASALISPRDWFVAAYAYMQLAVENPTHFRGVAPEFRLKFIMDRAKPLQNFLRSLVFTPGGSSINWPLHNALSNHYVLRQNEFSNAVRSAEQSSATVHHFALDTWRQWSAAAPCVSGSTTEVLAAPPPLSPIPTNRPIKIAVGQSHSLALNADGTVIGWGNNGSGQITIPGIATNVIAVAAGGGHSLALQTNGTVIGWGRNTYGQATGVANGPPGFVTRAGQPLTDIVAIAAGDAHSLALKADGTVICWGDNYFGQTDSPSGSDFVAVAAGHDHSIVLRANGTVFSWGYNYHGQTSTPVMATNVVAIAGGGLHSLALKADGTVLGWGLNVSGQSTGVPGGGTFGTSGIVKIGGNTLTNVVAIAAGFWHSVGLKADGKAVAWGNNDSGQASVPASATNVVVIAAQGDNSLFLKVTDATGVPRTFVLPYISQGVTDRLRAVNADLVGELVEGDLYSKAIELSGAKALITSVLELGMPYTLEQDDILHGFLYGSEPIFGRDAAIGFLSSENEKLAVTPHAKPLTIAEASNLRFQRFQERLTLRLNLLATNGQPELPRLVGHTLRLLNVLSNACTIAPPSLEISRQTNGLGSGSLGLVIYGEPYGHYTLQYRDNLSAGDWSNTTATNHNEQVLTPPVSGANRYYRTLRMSAP